MATLSSLAACCLPGTVCVCVCASLSESDIQISVAATNSVLFNLFVVCQWLPRISNVWRRWVFHQAQTNIVIVSTATKCLACHKDWDQMWSRLSQHMPNFPSITFWLVLCQSIFNQSVISSCKKPAVVVRQRKTNHAYWHQLEFKRKAVSAFEFGPFPTCHGGNEKWGVAVKTEMGGGQDWLDSPQTSLVKTKPVVHLGSFTV